MTDDEQYGQTAAERLRAELLIAGLSDWVSLAEVQQIITHFDLADSDSDRQDLTLATIQLLLADGLMQIGELPRPEEPFPAWEPTGVAMDRLRERFIDHFVDSASWDYSIWLGLTDAGRSIAEALRT